MRPPLLFIGLILVARALAAAECRPDHLTPVNPYPGSWHVRYTDLVSKHLEPPYRFFAGMIVRPSFEGEYSVILHGTKENYEVDLDKTPKFFLSCFAAEKNIWYSMPEHNEEKQQKEIKITVATGEVARPLAKRIHGLWVQMLERTRYFDDDRISVDGTTFEFTARGMHGETRLECTGPTLLVKLGHALVEFCQAPPTDREAATKNIEKAASELETYLKAHRVK